MRPAYLYPVTARYESEIVNPYMDDFQKNLGREFNFLNINKPSSTGILDLIKYYFKVKYIFLHWPENIPDRKYGFVQGLFLLFVLVFSRVINKKVVWTMHNRVSNVKTNLFFKKVLFKNLIRYSSNIITHASDGFKIAEKVSVKAARKVLVVPHPVKIRENGPAPETNKEHDILIWGTIVEYKGIDKFLEFLNDTGKIDEYKLFIAGKVLEDSYYEKIKKLLGKSTKLVNEYLDKDELIKIAEKSSVVLFPYNKEGVLSSGVLMDSLSWRSTILGPDTGAFHDCAEQKVIFSYSDFNDLLKKLEKILDGGLKIDKKVLRTFLEENTWEKFTREILNFLK